MIHLDSETAEAQLRSGEAWTQFCELLQAAGSVLQRDDLPDDAFTRAEGLRYLTRLVRAGLEAFVEHADPGAPVLARVVHETAKMGNDNPDNHYLNAALDGTGTYLLRGRRGTVHWLELATQRGSYGESRGLPPTGHLDGSALVLDDDGGFEVVIAAERPAGAANWLPMTPDTGTLIIRQSRLDPATETLAELHLERVGGPGPTPIDPQRAVTGLLRAGMLVGGAAQIFAEWQAGFRRDHLNRLPRFDQALSDAMGGVPHITYHHSAWALAPDEALVIDTPLVPCDHWNFQLSNHWLESLDYRHDRIHTNSKLARLRPDGTLRLVVAHTDPGVPNWLTTQGHAHGSMCFRWVHAAEDPPEPACRVVPVASVASLP
ncbi:MAG: DUF1214 domain-containing protein [Alphaproteobacteria bacterium]|nr:DUF1214 domain-containing protein [Alphaproteobacteria bacterium]